MPSEFVMDVSQQHPATASLGFVDFFFLNLWHLARVPSHIFPHLKL